MNSVLKFFLKLFFFLGSIGSLVFFVIMPQYSTAYTAAMIDKYDRLESLEQPKIVIVGDSSLAFGLDSKIIEERLGMPVVNFGLHAGLGQAFHSDMIRDQIKKDDIIILAPLGYYSSSARVADPTLAWLTIENDLSLWKNLRGPDAYIMYKSFPTYLKRCLGLWKTGDGNLPQYSAYSRAAFNQYGDVAFERPVSIMEDDNYAGWFLPYKLSDAMKDYWNDYNVYTKKRGATLLMSCPPILKETLADFSELQESLNALDFPVISNFEDYILPAEYFYDNGTHLNDAGRELRSKQLANDIQKYIDESKS